MDITLKERLAEAARIKTLRRAADEEVGATKLHSALLALLTPEAHAKAKGVLAELARATAEAREAWENPTLLKEVA